MSQLKPCTNCNTRLSIESLIPKRLLSAVSPSRQGETFLINREITMITPDSIDSFFRLLRPLAVTLMLVLGLEWSQPILLHAQQNGTSSVAASNDELPPIQEMEKVEDRKPFYKKWWFWTIVALAVGGATVAVAAGGGGGGGGAAPGSVTTKW
jgi:hypothetical protein